VNNKQKGDAMFRQQRQQPKKTLPIAQPLVQSASSQGSSSGIERAGVVEHGTVAPVIPIRQQSEHGQHVDNDIRSVHSADLEQPELARKATPFFVRGDKGDSNKLSKIDLENFDDYLTGLEALSKAVGGDRNKNEVQRKLVEKLEKIRAINDSEAKKMASHDQAVRDAAAGIDNVKAYTNQVTDLLRDAQAGAEHLAMKSFGNAAQKQKFECLAALLIQTKRLVRGVGAEKILIDAANTIDERLMALMGNRPDSSLITTKTVAVTPPKIFSKYTAGEVDSLVVDEQGLLLYFPAKTASVAGHGTVGIASMTGGVTATWGKDNFRAALTFSDLLKTTLNEKANANWIKSNGPAGRKLLQGLSAVRRGLGYISGQLHTEEFSSSIYSDDKLGKTRVENAFAINNAIKRSSLDADWKNGVDALVNKFFLPLADDIRIRQEDSLPAPANPYDVITELIKGSYSDHGANFTAQVGRRLNLGKISPSLSGTGVLSYDRFHFDMQLPSKPSDLLDSTYHQDVRETLKLHATIMQKVEAGPGAREKVGVFHQYDRMNTAFVALHAGTADRDFTADEINYFGNKDVIPSVFHTSILSSPPGAPARINNCLNDLAQINGRVVEALSQLGSPRGMPKGLKKEMEKSKEDIIKQIIADVWGDAYPDGVKGAMKDPEKFKRQTLYNLEIGLGRVGIELAMLNRHHEQGNTAFDDETLTALNKQYAEMKERLTSRDFLGNPNRDFALSPVVNTADFNRHQIIASGTMVAGANLSSLIYSGDVAPSNVAGDLYVKLQAQYENAVNQFDPTREGQFLVLSFELSSGVLSALPPAARLQEHVVHAVSKTAMAIVRKSIENEKVQFSDQNWQEISQHLVGVLGTNVQTGAKTAIKLHRPSKNTEWRLQKVTESKTQQGGIDAGFPFVEIVAKDSSTKQEQQIVGPDWSINKMTIKYLNTAVNDAGDIVLNDELATRYCSVPNTISQIIDDGMNWTNDYLARQDGQANQSAQGAENQSGGSGSVKQRYPSDIHRFLGDPVLVRSAEQAPKVSEYAPGTPMTRVESPLTRMANLCQQVGAPADWATTKAQWDATKLEIESLKTLDARRAYWEAPKGQALLKTFAGMIGIYTEVTTAAARHVDRADQVTGSGTVSKVKLPTQSFSKTLRDKVRRRKASNGSAAVEQHEMSNRAQEEA
jgi:hypothetical protein